MALTNSRKVKDEYINNKASPSWRRESRRPPSQGHCRAREDRSGRGFCTDGFRRNAGSGNRFGASNQSTRGIIRYCVEQRNEPKGGWFGARPKDRTGRSTSGRKQCLLLRRPDGCGG